MYPILGPPPRRCRGCLMLFGSILLKHAPGTQVGFEGLNDACACSKTGDSGFLGKAQVLSAVGDAGSESSASSKKDHVHACPEPLHPHGHHPSPLCGRLPLPSPQNPPATAWGIKSPLQAPRLQSGRTPWICSVPSLGAKEEPAPSGCTVGDLPWCRIELTSLHPHSTPLLPRRDLSSLCTMEFYFAILMQFWLRLKWNWKPKGLNK